MSFRLFLLGLTHTNHTTIYIYIYRHVAVRAQNSLALSRHQFLSSISPGRSSRQHPVSAEICCIYALAGRATFARPCERVHKSISLMSLSLHLQQCPASLVLQLLFYGVQRSGLVQYFSQHSCIIAVKLSFHRFSQRPCGASIQQVSSGHQLGKYCGSFYQSDLTSISPIAYHKLSMPLLVACCCHSRLIRRCCRCG